VVVTGHEAERVCDALAGLPVRCVVNPRFAEGMGTSLAAGIRALPPATAAAFIALGDQPLPRPDVVDRLRSAYRDGAGPIIAPVYAGTRGHPVLFDARLFPELLRLEGDRGAQDLLDAAPDRVVAIEFPHPPPPDIDTPEDLNRIRT
jgi:molybdenum cofactor cytidylyltransferase